jgi:hypothetical protein
MKFSIRTVSLIPCMAIALAAAPIAQAQVTSATVYENTPDAGNAADTANISSLLPNATFSVSGLGINFVSADDSSMAGFLNNPTFSNEQNGFSPTGNVNNSELVITGTTFLNAGSNSFVVGHDDGIVLVIPGIIDTGTSEAGGTSFTSTPFNVNNPGAAGEFAFTLDYAECCGAPADLLFTVNGAPITSTTPEPSSFVLFGSGLLAAAGMVRRRMVL